ncbi:MAG: hypothetical protein JNG89_11450, partial [Planctomycetaceae bacterium]|nr:hypothetical protein [Planctomycetaceae bacterium]
MIRPRCPFAIAALCITVWGCGIGIDTPGDQEASGQAGVAALPEGITDPDAGPFGPAKSTPLLAPFVGSWTRDFEKTLAASAAAGATPEEIAQTRAYYAKVPQLAELGARLTIAGDLVLGDPFAHSEYRLFALHTHGTHVCGKAWHHEDRFDPGDLSKCYVRLQLVEGDLHFETRMLDG